MHLVIVESPTKARKLAQYLGQDYQVSASVGHVRDLPSNGLGIDLEHNYEPTYIVNDDKVKVLRELTKYAKKAEDIYLATDPDREGEAIAWHLQELLKDTGSKTHPQKFYRSAFHEITKPAVLDAISHPGKIRMDLVNAQQARRVVDRLVGYQISPVLWQKVRRGLSAGRVQSVALKMIVEREREIAAFQPEEYWELDVALAVNNLDQKSHLSPLFIDGKPSEVMPKDVIVSRLFKLASKNYEPKTNLEVEPVTAWLPKAKYEVGNVEKKQRHTSSLPPFTTSTLQQAAANRLGMTSKQTMRLAQDLYEEGLITYHRTDSVNLSSFSIDEARKFIDQTFGHDYIPNKPRFFANKSKNAQEAHEAIRVTHVDQESVIGASAQMSDRHQKLYDLIRRRFLASQMSEAVFNQTTILVTAKAGEDTKKQAELKTVGSTILFEGWRKLFPIPGEVVLPEVQVGQPLFFQELNAAQKFTQPPARYNDASLVKELEKRGIGRPSTYASIISVIEVRGYVTRDNKRFVATPVGMTVSDFLDKHFDTIMDYDFTAEMEEDLDRVARGEKEWRQVVKVFYTPLEKKIADVKKNATREQIPVEKTGEPCPKCGGTEQGEIVIRSGRFGKFKSCSRFPDCDFTENLVEKLDGLKCPLCGEGDVIARKSRWGKVFYGCSNYPKCNWASWQKPEPGLKITAEEWAVMQAARQARAEARAAKRGDAPPAKATKPMKKTTKKVAKKTVKKTTRPGKKA